MHQDNGDEEEGENELQDMEAMAGFMAYQHQSEVMDEAAIKRALFKAARIGNLKEFTKVIN